MGRRINRDPVVAAFEEQVPGQQRDRLVLASGPWKRVPR